jgi:hypothetical protein
MGANGPKESVIDSVWYGPGAVHTNALSVNVIFFPVTLRRQLTSLTVSCSRRPVPKLMIFFLTCTSPRPPTESLACPVSIAESGIHRKWNTLVSVHIVLALFLCARITTTVRFTPQSIEIM